MLVGLAVILVVVGADLGRRRTDRGAAGTVRRDKLHYGLGVAVDQPSAALANQLDHFRRLGVTEVKAAAVWWWLCEAGPRRCNWRPLDRVVRAVAARGMSLTLTVSGTPAWVHPDLADRLQHFWYPPTRASTELGRWEQFVGDLVGRYGTRVDLYEVWNEPNTDQFWRTGPDPAAYLRLVRSAYLSAKRVNPEVTIAAGQLSRNDLGFLNGYYRAAEAMNGPEAAALDWYFDVLGVHPYCGADPPDAVAHRQRMGQFGEVDESFLGYRRMWELVRRREGRGKPLNLGEFGYSTTATWMDPVADATRAGWLEIAFRLADRDSFVRGLTWYTYSGHRGFDIAGTATERAFGEAALSL